jgi:hypothetical protein
MNPPFTHAEPRDLADCLVQMRRGRRSTRALLMNDKPLRGDCAAGLIDAVTLFERLDIGYALIGGVAAMVWGRSRYTEDVDFVAGAGHQQKLTDHAQIMRDCRFDPSCTWKLYHESGLEIDIWKDEHADGIIERAVEVKLAERIVKVAEPHDLIAMKLRADRPQDDYDISEIVKTHAIHDDTIQQRVTAEQFDRFIAIRNRVNRG